MLSSKETLYDTLFYYNYLYIYLLVALQINTIH